MARKHKVIVVGNGLFGSIAARLADQEGHEVTVIANNAPFAASPASGCVLAPSWLASLKPDQLTTAMSVLSEITQVHELTFRTNLMKTFAAKRVALDELLVPADYTEDVLEVGDGTVRTGNRTLRGKVLVAAGIGSFSLLPQLALPEMRALWGASLRVPGKMEEPRIHVYAPYRQAVAFNITPSMVWMGDGTALITKTWEKEGPRRVKMTQERAQDIFHLELSQRKMNVYVGARPYVEGHKAGYFEHVLPSTWISTGGAKNGTVLAAWQAHRFVREELK